MLLQTHNIILQYTAFSADGLVIWNSLPAAVREADSWYLFKHKLKTHLFTLF